MRRFLVIPLLIVLLCAGSFGAQLRQVAIIDLPGEPGFDQVIFANGMLVIAHQAAGTLDVFDPARRRIVRQLKDMGSPHGLAVNPKLGKLYVADSAAKQIAVISTRDWNVESTIAVQSTPYDLTLSPDGRRLYVANRRELSISVIDLAQVNRVATVNVGGSPAQIAFDPAQRVLFATLQDVAQVIALTADLKEVARYQLAASQPTGLIIDSAAHRLYVAVRHAVVALDGGTGTELGRVAAPEGADSMWLDTADGLLYVGSGGGFVTMIRTGGGNFAVVDEVRTEIRGHTLAYDPGRHLVYMPGGREGRSKLLILRNLAPSESEPVRQLANKK